MMGMGWAISFKAGQVIRKLFISVMLGAGIMASPALAVKPTPGALASCLLNEISPTALACSGFFAGNLLSGSAIAGQQAGLASIGFTWDGNFNQVTKIRSLGGLTTVDFSTAEQNPVSRIYGDTWIGVHFGNGAGFGDQVTGFWKLNAGATGLSSFILNVPKGSSGAVLYRTGSAPSVPPIEPPIGTPNSVPEPANWALLIAGFGLVGAAARRQRLATAR